MSRSPLSPLLFALSLSLLSTFVRAAAPLADAKFVGAVGCSSSSCHGGAGEKKSQFLTWTRQDFHTRAYAILTNARSERIAETLQLSRATESSRCTSCHSPFAAASPSRLTSAANSSEGVSCEHCHGAAAPWLRGHTRTDWTYATRVGAGMRDLRNLYVRANTCVACHQNLEAEIVAAGHPELIFELNRQSLDQPKHWHDPDGTSVRAWLVGQAVALRETSWWLAQNPTTPEPTTSQRDALVWLLTKVADTDPTLPPIDDEKSADAFARRTAQRTFGPEYSQRLLRQLAGAGIEFIETPAQPRTLLYRRGQRLLLALACLTSAETSASDEMEHLRQDLRGPENFQPANFAEHLASLKNRLTGAKE